MKTINIARDYSDTPLGRDAEDGEFNGERFREEYLAPALREHDRVLVEIDGAEGYGSSFLEEAFGGLVRKRHFKVAQLQDKLEVKSDDPDFAMFKNLIWRYIREAKAE